MSADITTIGGAPLSPSQGNAEAVVNPNENLLAQYATALGVSLNLSLTVSLTLLLSQMGPSLWIFGGTPSGAITATLQVISFAKKTVKNGCGKDITFTYGSGLTVTIPTGVSVVIYGDGTNIYAENGYKNLYMDYTNTATVGAVTINKPSGRVNIGAGSSQLTVTNSLVTAASHVFANCSQNDATAQVKSVIPSAGSFQINIVTATAQTSIDFLVINAD